MRREGRERGEEDRWRRGEERMGGMGKEERWRRGEKRRREEWRRGGERRERRRKKM